MVALARVALIVALLAGFAGCATVLQRSRPKTTAPLEVPLPPPRVVTPPEAEPPEPAPPPVEEPPSPPPARPKPSPPRPARPEKTDKPEATPAPAAPANPDPGPALSLQTTANVTAEETKIRTLIARASADLARIDYRALSADGKVQYDTAKRFRQQAEDALKVKNLVFAEQLADKAATMAALLLGR
jgi:outer membrane biosynthesis protein TonB